MQSLCKKGFQLLQRYNQYYILTASLDPDNAKQ